ncbi:MAG: hypothetical protein WBN20_06540 [Eudoraea sp.]|uniref:hypothetical protein n=1 Tax=Eudoraea sp. TaxID=1979955 RepID=UPI003C75B1E9
MTQKFNFYFFIIPLLVCTMACNNGPKVITPTSNSGNTENEGIFTPDPATRVIPNPTAEVGNELHKVVVEEVLPTARYVYLRVKEGEEEFWIATRKAEIKKGEVYFYRGGLLKTNFESKEYDRIFDEIYLISNLVSEDHSQHATTVTEPKSNPEKKIAAKEDIPTHTEKVIVHKGTIKISDLVNDPKKYEGHTVQLSGICVKVNPNIMSRNWIHLQDGSKDDFDMVITTNTFVPEGKQITIRAVVSLNRDFGAGYKYDLILENGTLVQ